MRKSTEGTPRAIAGVLYVVAFGRLVDLRMELLLSPGVTVLATVAGVARHGIAPFVARLDVGTRRRTVRK